MAPNRRVDSTTK